MQLYVLIVNQHGILDHLEIGEDLNEVLYSLNTYPVARIQCQKFIKMQQLLHSNNPVAFSEYEDYVTEFAMSDTDIYLREIRIDIPVSDIHAIINYIRLGTHSGIILDSVDAVETWLASITDIDRSTV